MSPPSTRRRKTLLGILILGAGLLAAALASADWRLLRAEYHAFRLDRAQTREQAEPHLEALLDLAGHEPAARAVVEKLGVERRWLTFWVFERIASLDPSPGSLLPWLREMVRRCESDPGTRAAWAHFARWWEPLFVRIAHTRALEETRDDTFQWFLNPSASSREPRPPVPLPGWAGPIPIPALPDLTGIRFPLRELFDP